MAIVSTKNASSIKLSLDCGLDDKGKTIVRINSFNNLNPKLLTTIFMKLLSLLWVYKILLC